MLISIAFELFIFPVKWSTIKLTLVSLSVFLPLLFSVILWQWYSWKKKQGGGSHTCLPDGENWIRNWPWNCPTCLEEKNGCFWDDDPEGGETCESDICHDHAFCGTTVTTG